MDATLLTKMIQELRGPGGCPWDQKQRIEDLRAYLVEEAHETAVAIDVYADARDNRDRAARAEAAHDLCGELGDLLFQLCFVAELASAEEAFNADEVSQRVYDKMVERHPHVYGDATLETAKDVALAWEQRKQKQQPNRSVLAGVPTSLPALTAAYRTGQKAAGLGFDWSRLEQVRAKIDEELAELDEAIADSSEAQNTSPGSQQASKAKAAVEEELGDALLSMASLARHLDIDPERALSRANLKFRRRFQHIEPELSACYPDQVEVQAEALWQTAKRELNSQSD